MRPLVLANVAVAAVVLLAFSAAVADEGAAAASLVGSGEFAALSDTLEPADESEQARLARQRAENTAVALFTLPTAPIEPATVRFRTSFYPVVHRAVVRREAGRPQPRTHTAVLAAAASDPAERAALAPGLAAEHFAIYVKADADRTEAETLLYRQSNFYTTALERIAALRLFNAGGMAAVDAADDTTRRVDFLAIGAIGARFVDVVGDPDRLAASFDGLGFAPDVARAAAVTALRSLGGPAPTSEQLALLGLAEGTPAAGAVAALGAVVLPFARRAADGPEDGFAERFLAELRAVAALQTKLETDLRARSATPVDAATLLVYVLKRIGVDPQLAAGRPQS